jgi:hypothetical protein
LSVRDEIQACSINRPAVFTGRCCKLMSDQIAHGLEQRQPLPLVCQVVGECAQPQAHFIGAEPVARKPRRV